MEDIKQQLLKKQRREEATRKIAEIDAKVKKCDDMRDDLKACKTRLDQKISDWESVKNALGRDPRYTKIVTSDVFEGNMAKRLGEYMRDVDTDIKSGITEAESLSDEVQTQISGLDSYRSSLMASRARWSNRLY